MILWVTDITVLPSRMQSLQSVVGVWERMEGAQQHTQGFAHAMHVPLVPLELSL